MDLNGLYSVNFENGVKMIQSRVTDANAPMVAFDNTLAKLPSGLGYV